MHEQRSATLADVAELAGVSLATASRALNGSARRVRPDFVERVLAAAVELQYSANVQAQAVARGTTNTLALIVGDVVDPYFGEIASGAIREAESNGLVVTMTVTNADTVRERSALAAVTGLRPRGVVVAASGRVPSGSGDDAVETIPRDVVGLLNSGSAVVLLDSDGDAHRTTTSGAQTLRIGNRAGAKALALALVEAGHRDFALIAGDPMIVTARERAAGFLDGLRERGLDIPPDRRVTSEFSRTGGQAAMRELLARGVRSGCIFAVTDVAAFGAAAAMWEFGLRPGVDIGLAGYDDVAMLQDVFPSLTTVRLPLGDIGAQAVRVALGERHDTPVEAEVVLRKSTAL